VYRTPNQPRNSDPSGIRSVQASHAMANSATISAMSSLSSATRRSGNSNTLSSRSRSRRSRDAVESESDDEKHDLNEQDDAWFELP